MLGQAQPQERRSNHNNAKSSQILKQYYVTLHVYGNALELLVIANRHAYHLRMKVGKLLCKRKLLALEEKEHGFSESCRKDSGYRLNVGVLCEVQTKWGVERYLLACGEDSTQCYYENSDIHTCVNFTEVFSLPCKAKQGLMAGFMWRALPVDISSNLSNVSNRDVGSA
ncbi:hypothetical protein Tco_1458574 [Tanacetum coccineum]